MNRVIQRVQGYSWIPKIPACAAQVRLYAQAGYGNVSETSGSQAKDSHIMDTSQTPTEGATRLEMAESDLHPASTKDTPDVKAARKKMRQGDQDAIRDYTASID